MAHALIALKKVISSLADDSSRRLLDFIEHMEKERQGQVPPPTLRLPPRRAVPRLLSRRLQTMDAKAKTEVLKYARYLKKCEGVNVEKTVTRAKHKVSWWAPTPRSIVIEALKLGDVGPQDILFDLGCGDGRVVADAAKVFGARAVGFDMNMQRIQEARARIRQTRMEGKAWVRRQSMLAIPDLYKATVIYLYLTQRALSRVVPLLARQCRKGTRIIAVENPIRRWPAQKRLAVQGKHYRWQIGLWYV
jgi:SAM-dependent methyltransferase